MKRLPDNDWLLDMAGPGAVERGVGYYRKGRVILTDDNDVALRAEARGSEMYALELAEEGTGWHWSASVQPRMAACSANTWWPRCWWHAMQWTMRRYLKNVRRIARAKPVARCRKKACWIFFWPSQPRPWRPGCTSLPRPTPAWSVACCCTGPRDSPTS